MKLFSAGMFPKKGAAYVDSGAVHWGSEHMISACDGSSPCVSAADLM